MATIDGRKIKTITSLNNAIKFFSANQRYETKRSINGEEHNVCYPPRAFYSMNVTDTNGITFHYYAFQYRDYADMLNKKRNEIAKISLRYFA